MAKKKSSLLEKFEDTILEWIDHILAQVEQRAASFIPHLIEGGVRKWIQRYTTIAAFCIAGLTIAGLGFVELLQTQVPLWGSYLIVGAAFMGVAAVKLYH